MEPLIFLFLALTHPPAGPGFEKRWRRGDSDRLFPKEDAGLPEAAPVRGLHV